MGVDCNDERIERPRRATPLDRNYWASFSSCPSLSSRNSRGCEGNPLNVPRVVKQDPRGSASSGRSVLERCSAYLPRKRQSAPNIHNCQRTRNYQHARNEAWDISPLDIIQDASRMFDSLFDRGPKPSCMKNARRALVKAKKKVSFAPTSPAPIRCDSNPEVCPTSLWYDPSALDQFARDAEARASIVRRSMNYASKNERTYNSATGLTSPEALGQYLSSPEEIIGIEHLLAGQDEARTSLRTRHRKILREEQGRQDGEERDPQLLAERLGNNSSIAAHMALERATYLYLID